MPHECGHVTETRLGCECHRDAQPDFAQLGPGIESLVGRDVLPVTQLSQFLDPLQIDALSVLPVGGQAVTERISHQFLKPDETLPLIHAVPDIFLGLDQLVFFVLEWDSDVVVIEPQSSPEQDSCPQPDDQEFFASLHASSPV